MGGWNITGIGKLLYLYSFISLVCLPPDMEASKEAKGRKEGSSSVASKWWLPRGFCDLGETPLSTHIFFSPAVTQQSGTGTFLGKVWIQVNPCRMEGMLFTRTGTVLEYAQTLNTLDFWHL